MSNLAPNQSAAVLSVAGPLGPRLRDLGLIEGTQVECLMRSPLGDPSAYLIRGAVIALRGSDAELVSVDPITSPAPSAAPGKAAPHGAA